MKTFLKLLMKLFFELFKKFGALMGLFRLNILIENTQKRWEYAKNEKIITQTPVLHETKRPLYYTRNTRFPCFSFPCLNKKTNTRNTFFSCYNVRSHMQCICSYKWVFVRKNKLLHIKKCVNKTFTIFKRRHFIDFWQK